ncbi:hypothetical protein PCANC_11257 [Puccinia coronata f. sp. avenae]|uniref:Uncharacterized protein n=1 Tax=Puccinia coronata f. sp. avenae TaxID=200324 RepID=A0A2N5T666_9BASI|nr:hypothetical protein PCANC_11257 [Puccinia coronata f. sp. avenae]
MARTYCSNNKLPPPETSSSSRLLPPQENSPPASIVMKPPLPSLLPESNRSPEDISALTGQKAPLPSAKTRPASSNQETQATLIGQKNKPEPAYTRLFPHPRDLPQGQGTNIPSALLRLSAFAEL